MTTWVPVAPAPALATGLAELATLYDFPEADFAERVAHVRSILVVQGDEPTRLAFESFVRSFLALGPGAREELHAATFEISPACVPYVSLHLFGEESFKRGAFMSALNARYAEMNFVVAGELPDHLAVMLRYADTTDETECRELTEFCLLGPLEKMIDALAEGNPYRALLMATRCRLQAMFPGMEAAVAPDEEGGRPGGSCGSGCAFGTPPSGGMVPLSMPGPTFRSEVEDD